ncbi:class I SAM-dependent methyltransferase [Amycolatopsis sp. SID8362]|uniref:class I SAM-dependent methyltransferase n=1 Tax=Amycolatopsis sp. SID8362 TaxID=2690346 RepID=UPI001369445A|nr:class I SAM-dependent methyltransferase [Amycolatopsis sp. SID8362]NBH11802.1 methyltransferase domain-containing protein [Amycolatopsis sp. SID8362]NED48494.1 class I SAM-dependent methyltransferase [Amycolatopsis sp. SID8362]
MPRIAAFLPAEHTLEIAPGHGRITQYLAPASERLSIVDLTEDCIAACRERFAAYDHIGYHVNDGTSLDMIDDCSVDFAFSWDSLVHVEADTMAAYIRQLGRKLRPGGYGFFHHSNLDGCRDPQTGGLGFENEHWRAQTMSAAKLQQFCATAGLRTVVQELLPWDGKHYTDCISVFRRDARLPKWVPSRPAVIRNTRFFPQVQQKLAAEIRAITRPYRADLRLPGLHKGNVLDGNVR